MTDNNKNFTVLLDAWLSGDATPVMHMQLLRLINTGEFDELLKGKIAEELYQFENTNNNDRNTEQILSAILNKTQAETHSIVAPAGRKKTRTLLKWAVAASVILLVSALSWFLFGKNAKPNQIAHTDAAIQPPAATIKEKKYIHLPDGSTVLLNEGSKLEFPENFGTSSREVTLTGEGYFDIRHEANRPFIVHTGKINTTVLGTAFNIKAYPQQKEVTVTVTRGKVKVSDDKKTLGILRPNESIAVNTNNKLFKQEQVNAEEIVEWKKQYLVLDNISLGDAAVLIDSRYHITISFSKEALKDCRISATFLNNESLEQVLKVVTGVINAHYSSQPNDQVIISGEGCK